MTQFWNQLQGVSLAGRYDLEQCLSSSEGDAWYLTRLEDGRPAALRTLPYESPYGKEQLAIWREAIKLRQPQLVRMLDVGRADPAGTPLIFAVCEFPDDFLAAAVQERALAAKEARDVLRVALAALSFLHTRGYVHTAVDPNHIMAFGNAIKLPLDTLRRAGDPTPEPGPYDPPEAKNGTVSPAGDMWSLGITLHEMLTQQRPNVESDPEFRYMAEPFATILRQTLRPDPKERWTIAQIEYCLDNPPAPLPPPKPVQAVVQEPPKPALPPLPAARSPRSAERGRPIPSRGFPIKWVPVAGVVAALGLSALLLRQPETARTEPAAAVPRKAAPAPETKAPASKPVADQASPQPVEAVPQSRPSPMPGREAAPPAPASKVTRTASAAAPNTGTASRSTPANDPPSRNANSTRIWRVVAWTYSSHKAAQHKVDSLNSKSSPWKAEVFAPNGSRAPYFVALGGRMTREDAVKLQQKAISKGLPRDTFVRNFSK